MRLRDFVPISGSDPGVALHIEELFGPEFFAVDETGQMVTTKRNQLLLMNARAVLRGFGRLPGDEIKSRLSELSALADVVRQRDYEHAVSQAIRESAASRQSEDSESLSDVVG